MNSTISVESNYLIVSMTLRVSSSQEYEYLYILKLTRKTNLSSYHNDHLDTQSDGRWQFCDSQIYIWYILIVTKKYNFLVLQMVKSAVITMKITIWKGRDLPLPYCLWFCYGINHNKQILKSVHTVIIFNCKSSFKV